MVRLGRAARLFTDDMLEPVANGHARAACRISCGLSRVGIDSFDAPGHVGRHLSLATGRNVIAGLGRCAPMLATSRRAARFAGFQSTKDESQAHRSKGPISPLF